METATKVFDYSKDWYKEIRKDEILVKEGKEFVFLRGLERLAKERGISEASSLVVSTPTPENPCAVVTFGYRFYDGGYYQASADARLDNCDKGFRLFLTAMAESRAKARALKTAFGISTCSVEEVSFAASAEDQEDETKVKANDQQKMLIAHLARSNKVSVEDVTGKPLDKLTKAEAKIAIAALNKPKKRSS